MWPHTITLGRIQSTQTGGNEEMSPVQHTQQQAVDATELGTGANCETAPRTYNRKIL